MLKNGRRLFLAGEGMVHEGLTGILKHYSFRLPFFTDASKSTVRPGSGVILVLGSYVLICYRCGSSGYWVCSVAAEPSSTLPSQCPCVSYSFARSRG